MTTKITVCSLNLPDKNDRGWASNPTRTESAISFLNAHGVDLVALQELATVSRNIIANDPDWGIVAAEPNNVFAGGRSLGNAIAFRKDVLRFIDHENIKVPMEGRARGLNMISVLFEHLDSKLRFVMVGAHNPSNRPSPRIGEVTRENAKAIELAYLNNCRNAELPVLLGGDLNEGNGGDVFAADGHNTGAYHLVDFVLGSGVSFSNEQLFSTGLRGVFTDHFSVAVDATLSTLNAAAKSLPRPNTPVIVRGCSLY